MLGSLGLTLGMLCLLSRSLSREVVKVAPACEEIEEVASLPVDPTLVRGLSSVARLYVMGDGWMDSWLVARRDSWEEVLPNASLQGSFWESELLETAWLLSSPVSEEELWRWDACALLKLRRRSNWAAPCDSAAGGESALLGNDEETGVGWGSGGNTLTGGRDPSLVPGGEGVVPRASNARLMFWNLCTRRSSCEAFSLSNLSSVRSRLSLSRSLSSCVVLILNLFPSDISSSS